MKKVFETRTLQLKAYMKKRTDSDGKKGSDNLKNMSVYNPFIKKVRNSLRKIKKKEIT